MASRNLLDLTGLVLWEVRCKVLLMPTLLNVQRDSHPFWLFHGNRLTAGCEAHTDFDDESICMLADNVWNEVVTIHRLQEVLQMLSPYM
jgi:hypothetical protein